MWRSLVSSSLRWALQLEKQDVSLQLCRVPMLSQLFGFCVFLAQLRFAANAACYWRAWKGAGCERLVAAPGG